MDEVIPAPPKPIRVAPTANYQNSSEKENITKPQIIMQFERKEHVRGPKLSRTIPNRNGENIPTLDAQVKISVVSFRLSPAPPFSMDSESSVLSILAHPNSVPPKRPF